MKVLVTGATGFVGSAMIAHLHSRNDVTPLAGVRRAGTTFPIPIEMRILGDFGGRISSDIDLKGIDAIVHCAARVHVMKEDKTKAMQAYLDVNTEGTASLAQMAAEAGVRRFVFVSSVKVNGELTIDGHKFGPDDMAIPEDPYGISKLAAEKALREISANSEMEVVIVRPPLVYGPGVGANFFKMMQWVKRGTPLPLRNIHNKRSLVSLDNLTDFLWNCVHQPRAANQVFLVSDDEDVSTSALLTKLANQLEAPSRLFYVPRPLIQMATSATRKQSIYDRLFGSLQMDISKSKTLLDWTPPKSLDQSLASTANWFRMHKQQADGQTLLSRQ